MSEHASVTSYMALSASWSCSSSTSASRSLLVRWDCRSAARIIVEESERFSPLGCKYISILRNAKGLIIKAGFNCGAWPGEVRAAALIRWGVLAWARSHEEPRKSGASINALFNFAGNFDIRTIDTAELGLRFHQSSKRCFRLQNRLTSFYHLQTYRMLLPQPDKAADHCVHF